MNQSIREVMRDLAGNQNIEAIPLEDLQKLADNYPYFPVAQLLLAKKLKVENNSLFLQQAQKTALYVSNPYWLHYQLVNDWRQDEPLQKKSPDEKLATDESTIAKLSEKKEAQEISEVLDVSEAKPGQDVAVQASNELMETPAKEAKQVEIIDETFAGEDAALAAEHQEKVSQPEEEMAALTRDTDAAAEEFLTEADTREGTIASSNGSTIATDNIEQVITQTQNPATIEVTEVLEEMAGVSHETGETTEAFLNEASKTPEENIEPSLPKAEPPAQTDNVSSVIENENGNPDEHERMFQNIKAMLDATSEEADAGTENAIIPIDPYYTIDYFASQGIKLELEQNPKDQLGQNLKKFTQWLKHMKKLGPEDAAEVITRTGAESDIQKIAESSNTVREVVTEAMASVLEKQGKKEKAIELYKKLSFLNPDKSAYFADKIKNLKGI